MVEETIEQKRAFVNEMWTKSHNLMILGDKNYDQFYHKDAHGLYIQAVEVLMELLKKTTDDPNFQAHLKERINYALDRAQKCKTYVSTQMQNKH